MSEDPLIATLPPVGDLDGRHLSLSVAESLKQAIRSGALQPGDRLPNEQALCEHFGVSRITLREAVQMLRGLGLVEPTRGRGTYIREPDPSSFIHDLAYFAFTGEDALTDLFEVRCLLESHAAERAALQGTVEAKQRLLSLAEEGLRFVTAVDEPDLDKVTAMDMDYHMQIVVMSNNLVLEQLMNHLMQILESVRPRTQAVPGQLARSWRQHCDIAEAISRADSTESRSRITAHMEAVRTASFVGQPNS